MRCAKILSVSPSDLKRREDEWKKQRIAEGHKRVKQS